MTTPQPSVGGPTVRRMLLGAQLRKLREAAEITRDAAGWRIRASESKISRMELGRVGFKERDVADLLTLFGVSDPEERNTLLELAREANTPGWWPRYGDVLPGWFQSYVGLEASAARIRTYEVQFMPGLLQTEEYAWAVVRLGHPGAPPAEIERRVQLRMERQQILQRADPPQLWAVLDEAVLRRPHGSLKVMCAQLEALIEAAERPNVTVQIAAFGAGGHPAVGGAFTLLRFGEQDLPDVVYTEQLTGALYLDKRADVEAYTEAMDLLSVVAEPPTRTAQILTDTLSSLTR